MIDRLDLLEKRYEEISNLLTQNEVVSDVNRFANKGENVYAEVKSIDEDNKKCILSVKGLNYRADIPRKINETVRGFTPLKEHLPIWIEKKLSELEENGI